MKPETTPFTGAEITCSFCVAVQYRIQYSPYAVPSKDSEEERIKDYEEGYSNGKSLALTSDRRAKDLSLEYLKGYEDGRHEEKLDKDLYVVRPDDWDPY